MRILSLRIQDCFGFRDSGTIDLSSSRSFFYVLGRNSSGKTALLTALRHLENDVTPGRHPKFKNYNVGTRAGSLQAAFDLKATDLSFERLQSVFKETIEASGLARLRVEEQRSEITESLLSGLRELYAPLLNEMSAAGAALVRRVGDGSYSFGVGPDWAAAKDRRIKARSLFTSVAPDGTIPQKDAPQQKVPVSLADIEPENLLFQLFPHIYFFDQAFSLADDLPNSINGATLKDTQNSLTEGLLDYLTRDDIRHFLRSEDPDEQAGVLERLQARLNELAKAINFRASGRPPESLIEFVIHSRNGLQLTLKTDGKRASINI